MTAVAALDLRPDEHPQAGALSPRALGVLLLVTGLVGETAAFVLTVEKFLLLTNPFYAPTCSVNARVNCGSVMTSPQAEVFGFPNSLLGVAGFAVLAAAGAALLAAGQLAGWYWVGLQVGVTAATVFVHWLLVQSVFVIGALCPYCMVVWVVTITAFWYITLHNLTRRRPTAAGFAVRNHSVLLASWFLALTCLVVGSLWLV